MTITFELHGALVRLFGRDEVTLTLPPDATLEAALGQLAEGAPDAWSALERCACALEDRLVFRTQTLEDGMRLALLPPVAGG